MIRLNQYTIENLPPEIKRPNYDYRKVKPGIMHLGVGAFHRAHQAVFTDRVLEKFGGDWGIIGGDLRSGRVRDELDAQDGLYCVVVRDNGQEHIQVVGSIVEECVGPDYPAHAVEKMAEESVKVISLTVTEKGYCHDPATGDLNVDHPEIQHDLKNLASPKSTPGFVVAALKRRMELGVKSCTLMSCDNLPNNGKVLQKVIKQFAELTDKTLARWIEDNTTFPCTMVDRIVPATTDSDRERLAERIGMRDKAMVVTEPFMQWVIEDNFCNQRPPWEGVGALMVDDVEPFELMKLRLLNGSHSLLAYCGYLSGFETIDEVMSEKAFVNVCEQFMERDAGQTITAPQGFDIEAYKQQLRERFANRGLKHRTWQIAMDGSQKLPQRLLNSVREQLKGEGNIEILSLAVAGWMRYVTGVDEQWQAIDVRDPMAKRLRQLCDANNRNPSGLVEALINVRDIFGEDLAHQGVFKQAVTEWLQQFYDKGVLNAIKARFSSNK